MIPVFIVALLSDKDENAINNRKDISFHLIKCSDQLYGSIVSKNTNWNKHLNFDILDFLGSPYINDK